MTAVTDRATVSLALECASRLRSDMVERCQGSDSITYLPLSTGEMLEKADQILTWIDARCAERAKRDALRVNAPKIELHPGFAGS